MHHSNWKCPKCNNQDFETDTIRATGDGLSRLFDIQNRKFTAVTCQRCSYTEFYRGTTRTIDNIFDLILSP